MAKAVEPRSKLLSLYELIPFAEHPLWKAILNHELTLEQILRAELQHYLRTKEGQKLRREAVEKAKEINERLFKAILQTYLEECTSQTGPSHLELIKRLLTEGGITENELAEASPTPGNAAAIALYRDISDRGAGCHMLGAGMVEFYYCKLAPQIYQAYVKDYGMSEWQAETYRIHGPMDKQHADRALAVLDDTIAHHGWKLVENSVRDAFVATSLHYDGMLQAALGRIVYWNGA